MAASDLKRGIEVELVAALDCAIAECPLWIPERNALLFVDIPTGRIFSYSPANRSCWIVSHTRPTGGFTIQSDGSLLLFQDGCISNLDADGKLHRVLENACPGNDRFNDVISDPEGRIFAGTMGGSGKLVRIDLDAKITTILDGLDIPNGMGFTPDLQQFYFTESVTRKIYRFDYNRTSGELSNQRLFAEIPREIGLPDGMTVDREGYVWTAIWFGGRLRRYTPDGRLDREIILPVTQPSSVAFGGDNLGDLYVTSAAEKVTGDRVPPGYDFDARRGGGLYRLRDVGAKGRPIFRSKVKFL